MKKMKKLVGILLTLAMVVAMSITAFAANITINGGANGSKYAAYKLLNATDLGASKYDYKVNTKYEAALKDAIKELKKSEEEVTDEEVIKETKKLGKVSIPGAMTPTEAAFAYKCGADIVKLFPAGVLGAAYIKALKAPLKHIPVTAVGSVNPQNCAEFIKAGCVGVGCGGNLVSAKLVNEGRFDEITAVAKEYMEALSNC